jgi:hypothetical protein
MGQAPHDHTGAISQQNVKTQEEMGLDHDWNGLAHNHGIIDEARPRGISNREGG